MYGYLYLARLKKKHTGSMILKQLSSTKTKSARHSDVVTICCTESVFHSYGKGIKYEH